MNPFTNLESRRSPWLRWLTRLELVVFGICLAAGLALVGCRAVFSNHTAHALARAEVQARAAMLEAQLNQVPAAAEVLGASARQGRAGFPDFQKVATELLHRYPGLSSVELQPGGFVTEVVPREGNERALGVNVLRDASLGAGANEAVARRTLTVSAPVKLYRGEQGIVARVPIFQRTPEGRETFWGFVATSMRFQAALAWTEVELLPRRGYGFAFFVPPAKRDKGLTITADSLTSLQDTEQQRVGVQGVEFWLALKPRAGWVNTTELAVEGVLALLFAALAGLLAWVWGNCRLVEAELAQMTNRVGQEQSKRAEAEAAFTESRDQLAALRSELLSAQLGSKQAAAQVAQVEAQLEASVREREEAVQVHLAKLQETQTALAQAQETIAQLQARLEAAAQGERTNAAAADERLRHHQTALSELRSKLEAATRTAREEAKAKAVELAQLEQDKRELTARLAEAAQTEARVEELEALLREAQEELKQRSTGPVEESEPLETEAPLSEEAPVVEEVLAVEPIVEADAEPAATVTESVPTEPAEAPPAAEPEAPVVTPATESAPTETEEQSVPETEAQAAPPVAPAPPAAEPEMPSEPVAAAKSAAKPPRRRKSSRDDQMDLFAAEAPAVQASSKPVAKATEPPAEKPTPRLPPAPPLDEAEFRQAVHLIVPLLADQDPGAKDCLRDNRNTFRSGFTPEAYVEFEQFVKRGDYGPALEDLKKAARKHGISV